MTDSNTEAVTLKPCPFCGSDAEHIHMYAYEEVVRCTNECCLVRPEVHCEMPEECFESWNTRAALTSDVAQAPFQSRVQPWMLECFGAEIAADKIERNHRFFEEATELVQACGMTASEAHQLVDYTFGRPIGEPTQETGGVMVTLAALCLANDLDMHAAGETELARISVPETVAKIRAKQAAKPKHSPLPVAPTPETVPEGYALVPLKPNDAMQAAGAQAVRMDTTVLNRIWTANAVFRAMVDAALAATAQSDAEKKS